MSQFLVPVPENMGVVGDSGDLRRGRAKVTPELSCVLYLVLPWPRLTTACACLPYVPLQSGLHVRTLCVYALKRSGRL